GEEVRGEEALLCYRRIGRFMVTSRFQAVSLSIQPEIVEHTYQVAIQVRGQKLAQLPRFVLRFGNDLRTGSLPLRVNFVHLSLAVEVEPEKDWTRVAITFSERTIRNKQSAIPLEMPPMPPCSSPQSKLKPSVFT